MNIKKLPYWLKGGILGLAIFLIYRFLVFLEFIFCFGKADLKSCSPTILDIIYWPFDLISVPIYDLFQSSIFLVFIFHIVCGMTIGWLYGKIKNIIKN